MKSIYRRVLKIPTTLVLMFNSNFLTLVSYDKCLKSSFHIPRYIKLEKRKNKLFIFLTEKNAETVVFETTWSTMLKNTFQGLTRGYSLSLQLKGVGFRAQLRENIVSLKLGHSHSDEVSFERGVSIGVSKNISLLLKSASKSLVSQYGARLKALRSPDAYKGKGVLYKGEELKLKLGKKT